MHSSNIKKKKFGPLHAIAAVAVLTAVAMPLAVAGATPGASTAKVTNAKFAKLKQRVGQLENKTGQAGGDLQGQYPNPEIRDNAVGTDEVAKDSLTIDDIADNAIGAGELANSSVGTDELQGNIVGNSALKGIVARVSAGAGSNNTFVTATATCNAGEIVVGGGYAWTADTGTDMVANAPVNAAVENQSWVARGRSSAANTLFAWANCLAL
jgi:hypothetical protein